MSYLLQKSSITSSSPLDVIFSDLLTSPISSSDGFNYYVIFVDHYTKYIWLYGYVENRMFIPPLLPSSNLLKTISPPPLKHFTQIIWGGGGEFLVFQSFLATHGIANLTTPLHTPEHNGYSERRHRHFVEKSLTLMHQASIPLTF